MEPRSACAPGSAPRSNRGRAVASVRAWLDPTPLRSYSVLKYSKIAMTSSSVSRSDPNAGMNPWRSSYCPGRSSLVATAVGSDIPSNITDIP